MIFPSTNYLAISSERWFINTAESTACNVICGMDRENDVQMKKGIKISAGNNFICFMNNVRKAGFFLQQCQLSKGGSKIFFDKSEYNSIAPIFKNQLL